MTDRPQAAVAERKRRDYRPLALLLVAISVASLGYLVSLLPGRGVSAGAATAPNGQLGKDGFHDLKPFTGEPTQEAAEAREETPPADDAARNRRSEVRQLLRDARKALQNQRHAEAEQLVNQAGRLDPSYPPSYMAMGDILLAQRKFGQAQFFFERAIDLDPGVADAYFGHAAASEGLGDLELALSGMRSFLHVAGDADPFRLKVAQARSAIWEWEAQLGRGPWGPTRGIPPSFTADELRRDGKGVAVRMESHGPPAPDGSVPYEIKAADKFKLFRKP